MSEQEKKKVKRDWGKLSIHVFGWVFLALFGIYPMANALGLRGYHPHSTWMLLGGHGVAVVGLFLARWKRQMVYVTVFGLAVMGLGGQLEVHFHDRGHRKFCQEILADRFCNEESQQIVCRPPSKMGGAVIERSTCEEYL